MLATQEKRFRVLFLELLETAAVANPLKRQCANYCFVASRAWQKKVHYTFGVPVSEPVRSTVEVFFSLPAYGFLTLVRSPPIRGKGTFTTNKNYASPTDDRVRQGCSHPHPFGNQEPWTKC